MILHYWHLRAGSLRQVVRFLYNWPIIVQVVTVLFVLILHFCLHFCADRCFDSSHPFEGTSYTYLCIWCNNISALIVFICCDIHLNIISPQWLLRSSNNGYCLVRNDWWLHDSYKKQLDYFQTVHENHSSYMNHIQQHIMYEFDGISSFFSNLQKLLHVHITGACTCGFCRYMDGLVWALWAGADPMKVQRDAVPPDSENIFS